MTVRGRVAGRGKAFATLVLLAGALLLSGCAGASNPVTSTLDPPAQPTQAPATASARPPGPAAVTDILVSATSIEVRDGSGQALAVFDYFQPATELVAGLSTALGTAPTSEHYEGNSEVPPGTRYIWGNVLPADPESERTPYPWGDFVLLDGAPDGTPPYDSNTWVMVSAGAVNGVHISTVDGIAVGDNAAELEARYPDTSFRHPLIGQPGLDIVVGSVSLEPFDQMPDPTFSVRLHAADPLGPITGFGAPIPNWGA